MASRANLAIAFGTAALVTAQPVSDIQPDLRPILVRDLKFSAGELADLEHGKIVRHTLPPSAPGEVAAVGAVRINAPRARLVAAYRDIVRFKRNPSVLELGVFSNPPVLPDLDGLSITPDDFDLRQCKVGDCDIRLPAALIQRFEREIDWRRPDAASKAAGMFKQILVDDVQAYAAGTPRRITEYDDGGEPIKPEENFDALLKSSPYVEAMLPGLGVHVGAYPAGSLIGAEDFLYWSKEKFGIAPFISVTHVTIVPAGVHQSLMATRDVYSSRYFDASLSLAIASDSVSNAQFFYLVYVNRSRASALRGAFSRIRRTIVERRAKASLEENLKEVKQRLE